MFFAVHRPCYIRVVSLWPLAQPYFFSWIGGIVAKKRMVETSMWNDAWFLSLSCDAKLLFQHILTSPLTKESGFLECPDTLLIPYLYPYDRIEAARKEIQEKVLYDKQFNLYLMINFYEKNCKSFTMIKGAINDLQRYKRSFLSSFFIERNSYIPEFEGMKVLIGDTYPPPPPVGGCREREREHIYSNIGSRIDLDLEKKEENKDPKEKTEDKPEDLSKRTKYGKYKHVLLTGIQFQSLIDRFGDKTESHIQNLDEAIEMYGYKYKNHYLVILKWSKEKKGGNKDAGKADNRTEPTGRHGKYEKFVHRVQDVPSDTE